MVLVRICGRIGRNVVGLRFVDTLARKRGCWGGIASVHACVGICTKVMHTCLFILNYGEYHT